MTGTGTAVQENTVSTTPEQAKAARLERWKAFVRNAFPQGMGHSSLDQDFENLQAGDVRALMVEDVAKGLMKIADGFKPPSRPGGSWRPNLPGILEGIGLLIAGVWRADEGLSQEQREAFIQSLIQRFRSNGGRSQQPGPQTGRRIQAPQPQAEDRTVVYWDAAVHFILAAVRIWSASQRMFYDPSSGGVKVSDAEMAKRENWVLLAQGFASLARALLRLASTLDGEIAYVVEPAAADSTTGVGRATDIRDTRDGDNTLANVQGVIAGMGPIVHQFLKFYKHHVALFPEDLRGTWLIEGDDDPWAWQLKLGAPDAEGNHLGKLLVNGVDRAGRFHKCEQGDVVVSLLEEGWISVTCTRKHSASPFTTSVDLAMANAPTSEDRLEIKEAARLLERAGCTLLGQPADLVFSRDHSPEAALGWLLELGKVLWTCRLLIPPDARKSMARGFAAALQELGEKIPFIKFLLEKKLISLNLATKSQAANDPFLDEDDLLLRLGYEGRRLSLHGSWNLSAMLKDDAFAGGRSALAPTEIQGWLKLPKGLKLKLEGRHWDPSGPQKQDPDKDSISKKVPYLSWFIEHYLSYPGLEWQLGAPVMSMGKPGVATDLPELGIPIELFLRRIEDVELNAKLVVTILVTGETLANCIPVLRAMLAAWEIGCAIGTLLHGVLMHFEWARNAEDWTADQLAHAFDPQYAQNRRFDLLGNSVLSPAQNQPALNYYERTLLRQKFALFARGEEHWQGRQVAQDTRDRQLECLRQVLVQLVEPRTDFPDDRLLPCAAAVHLYQYLWGDDYPRAQLLAEIEAAVQKQEISRARSYLYLGWLGEPFSHPGAVDYPFFGVMEVMRQQLDPEAPLFEAKKNELDCLEMLGRLHFRDDANVAHLGFPELCRMMRTVFPFSSAGLLQRRLWSASPPSLRMFEEGEQLVLEVDNVPVPDGTKLHVRFADQDFVGDRDNRELDGIRDDTLNQAGYSFNFFRRTVADGKLRIATLRDFTWTNHGGERVVELYPKIYADNLDDAGHRVWYDDSRVFRVQMRADNRLGAFLGEAEGQR